MVCSQLCWIYYLFIRKHINRHRKMSQIIAVILDVNSDYETAAGRTVKVMTIYNVNVCYVWLGWNYISPALVQGQISLFFVRRLTTAIIKQGIAKYQPKFRCLLQPHLEFASAAWDPYTARDINQLDKVQRCAARFVKKRLPQNNICVWSSQRLRVAVLGI